MVPTAWITATFGRPLPTLLGTHLQLSTYKHSFHCIRDGPLRLDAHACRPFRPSAALNELTHNAVNTLTETARNYMAVKALLGARDE